MRSGGIPGRWMYLEAPPMNEMDQSRTTAVNVLGPSSRVCSHVLRPTGRKTPAHKYVKPLVSMNRNRPTALSARLSFNLTASWTYFALDSNITLLQGSISAKIGSPCPVSKYQRKRLKRGRRKTFLCWQTTCVCNGGPALPSFIIERP